MNNPHHGDPQAGADPSEWPGRVEHGNVPSRWAPTTGAHRQHRSRQCGIGGGPAILRVTVPARTARPTLALASRSGGRRSTRSRPAPSPARAASAARSGRAGQPGPVTLGAPPHSGVSRRMPSAARPAVATASAGRPVGRRRGPMSQPPGDPWRDPASGARLGPPALAAPARRPSSRRRPNDSPFGRRCSIVGCGRPRSSGCWSPRWWSAAWARSSACSRPNRLPGGRHRSVVRAGHRRAGGHPRAGLGRRHRRQGAARGGLPGGPHR